MAKDNLIQTSLSNLRKFLEKDNFVSPQRTTAPTNAANSRFQPIRKIQTGLQQAELARLNVGRMFDRGVGRVKESFKDPLQYTPLSMREQVVPIFKGLGQQLGNDQLGEDLGYGFRGALSLTPFQRGGAKLKASTPQTKRQQTAQDVGQALYGTALTAPLGGKGGYVANITSRVPQAAVLGAGMTTASSLIGNKRLPSKEELGEGVLRGVGSQWKLAITNAVTNKALGSVAPQLTDSGIDQVFKNKEFKKGVQNLFLRALAEVPAENTAFVAFDKLGDREKRDFIQAWMQELPGNILGNLAFAAVQTGGRFITTPEMRQEFSNALERTVKKQLMPVTTARIDPSTGERITKPMLQYQLEKRVGLQAQDINDLSLEDIKAQADFLESSKEYKGALAKYNESIEQGGVKSIGERQKIFEQFPILKQVQDLKAKIAGEIPDNYKFDAETGRPKLTVPGYEGKVVEVPDEGITVFRAKDSTSGKGVIGAGTYVGESADVAAKYGKDIQELQIKPGTKLLDLSDTMLEDQFKSEAIKANRKLFVDLTKSSGPDEAIAQVVRQHALDLGFDGIRGDNVNTGTVIFDKANLLDSSVGSKGFIDPNAKVGLSETPAEKQARVAQEFEDEMNAQVKENFLGMEETAPKSPKYDEADINYKATNAVTTEDEVGVFEGIIRKWIGSKDAAVTEGGEAGIKYSDLPQGKEEFASFMDVVENGKKTGDPTIDAAAQQWKKETDELYGVIKDQAERVGIEDMGYVKNYATHYWEQTPEEVQAIMLRASKGNPSFKARTIPTYSEGIALGLTPKYDSPAQVMSEYVRRLYTTKANLDLFADLQAKGLLVDGSVAKQFPGFEPINGPGFPRSSTSVNGTLYETTYYAPSYTANKLNQLFSYQEADKTLKAIADATKKYQEITLSGGIPGTPLNAFSFAQVQKEVLSGRVRGPMRAVGIALKGSDSANKYFLDNSAVIKEMQVNNVGVRTTLNTRDLAGGMETFGDKWDAAVSDPTFKRLLPIMQIEFFKDAKVKALQQGMNPMDASEVASQAVRNFYGVSDPYKVALRSPNAKNVTSSLFFAPSFREAMVNFWVNNIKALKNPTALENQANVKFMAGSAITFGLMNFINEQLNGHSMFENPDGKQDKLLIPAGDMTIGIPFLSSIATVPRGLAREINYLRQGQLGSAVFDAFQTFASSTLKPIGDLAMNSDYFGNEIYDEQGTTGERLKAQVGYIGKQLLGHPYLKSAVDAIQKPPNSPLGVFKTISTAAEAPIRFYSTQSINRAPFWEAYNESKDAYNYYNELKYKEPDKALNYLNENKELISNYGLMRAKVQQYYEGGEKDESLLTLGGSVSTYSGKITDQERSFIKERIKLGDTVSNQEIVGAFLGDVSQMPNESRYEKSLKESALFSKISDVDNNEYLTPQQKELLYAEIAKQAGLSVDDIGYYKVAKNSNDEKTMFVLDQVESFQDNNELLAFLTQGRRKVNGKLLVSDGVIDNLVDEGILPYALGKELKKIKYNDDGTVRTSRSGGSSGGSKKAKAVPTLKLNVNLKQTPIKAPRASKLNVKPRVSATLSAQPEITGKDLANRVLQAAA